MPKIYPNLLGHDKINLDLMLFPKIVRYSRIKSMLPVSLNISIEPISLRVLINFYIIIIFPPSSPNIEERILADPV